MFVTCLIFPISVRNFEETFAFSWLLLFSRFHLKLVWLKNACVFSKCFLSNNLFHFGCENSSSSLMSLSTWAQNWLKKSQAKSGWFISSAPLGKFSRVGLTFWKLSQRATTPSLPKVNTIFNSCSIGNASNMLPLTAILSKATIFCDMTAIM